MTALNDTERAVHELDICTPRSSGPDAPDALGGDRLTHA